MYRLLETIRLENGNFHRLDWHEERRRKSLRGLFNHTPTKSLADSLAAQPFPTQGLYKCRVVYNAHEEIISFSPYQPKLITHFQLVEHNTLDYIHKFEDRTEIEKLAAQTPHEIIIVKNNFITDASMANLVFEKKGEWFTPEQYLLNGTMRQYLLHHKKIKTADIRTDTIFHYEHIKLINAMLGFDMKPLPVSCILS